MFCVGLPTDGASHHWLKWNLGPLTKMVSWFSCVFTAAFISLGVLKAACHITVHKMLWCHSQANNELYINCSVKGWQSIYPAGWKKVYPTF